MPIFSMFAPEGAPNVPMEQLAAQRDADAMRAAMQRFDIESRERAQERAGGRQAEQFERTQGFEEEKFRQRQESDREKAERADVLTRRGQDIQQRGVDVTRQGQIAAGERHAQSIASTEKLHGAAITANSEAAKLARKWDVKMYRMGHHDEAKKYRAEAEWREKVHDDMLAEQTEQANIRREQTALDATRLGRVLNKKTGQWEKTPEQIVLDTRFQESSERLQKMKFQSEMYSQVQTFAQQGLPVRDPKFWENLPDGGISWDSVKGVVAALAPDSGAMRIQHIRSQVGPVALQAANASFIKQGDNENNDWDHDLNWKNWRELEGDINGFLGQLTQYNPEFVGQAIELALQPGTMNPETGEIIGGHLWKAAQNSETPDPFGRGVLPPSVILQDFRERMYSMASNMGPVFNGKAFQLKTQPRWGQLEYSDPVDASGRTRRPAPPPSLWQRGKRAIGRFQPGGGIGLGQEIYKAMLDWKNQQGQSDQGE